MANKTPTTNPTFKTESDPLINLGKRLAEAEEVSMRATDAREAVTMPLIRKGVHVPDRNVQWREAGDHLPKMVFCEEEIRGMASPILVNDLILQFRAKLAERVRLGLKELDEAYDEANEAVHELRAEIFSTPASSLAGVLVKFTELEGGDYDGALFASIRSDLERMGGAS